MIRITDSKINIQGSWELGCIIRISCKLVQSADSFFREGGSNGIRVYITMNKKTLLIRA